MLLYSIKNNKKSVNYRNGLELKAWDEIVPFDPFSGKYFLVSFPKPESSDAALQKSQTTNYFSQPQLLHQSFRLSQLFGGANVQDMFANLITKRLAEINQLLKSIGKKIFSLDPWRN